MPEEATKRMKTTPTPPAPARRPSKMFLGAGETTVFGKGEKQKREHGGNNTYQKGLSEPAKSAPKVPPREARQRPISDQKIAPGLHQIALVGQTRPQEGGQRANRRPPKWSQEAAGQKQGKRRQTGTQQGATGSFGDMSPTERAGLLVTQKRSRKLYVLSYTLHSPASRGRRIQDAMRRGYRRPLDSMPYWKAWWSNGRDQDRA